MEQPMDRTWTEYLKPAPQHRRFVRLAETARPAKARNTVKTGQDAKLATGYTSGSI
jgi:hypothetical protein